MNTMTCYEESSWCLDVRCPNQDGKIRQHYVSCIGEVGTTCSC